MNSVFKRFIIELMLGVFIAFAIHIALLHFASLSLFENKIIASYIINTLLAIVIFSTLYLLRNKFKNQLGFLFMGGSFLKFFVFFLFFLPIYKEDGSTNRLEFAAFFVPYIVCLIVETLGVKRILND